MDSRLPVQVRDLAGSDGLYTYYPDDDGDGFGVLAPTRAITLCGPQGLAPAGYSIRADDCCDRGDTSNLTVRVWALVGRPARACAAADWTASDGTISASPAVAVVDSAGSSRTRVVDGAPISCVPERLLLSAPGAWLHPNANSNDEPNSPWTNITRNRA